MTLKGYLNFVSLYAPYHDRVNGVPQILSATVISYDYLIYSATVTQIINGFCGAVPFSGVMYVTGSTFLQPSFIVVFISSYHSAAAEHGCS